MGICCRNGLLPDYYVLQFLYWYGFKTFHRPSKVFSLLYNHIMWVISLAYRLSWVHTGTIGLAMGWVVSPGHAFSINNSHRSYSSCHYYGRGLFSAIKSIRFVKQTRKCTPAIALGKLIYKGIHIILIYFQRTIPFRGHTTRINFSMFICYGLYVDT